MDLDFLMVEYNLGKPVGLIEYKHHHARLPDLRHATYRALIELANAAQLPFMVAFYWPTNWAFRVSPVNDVAHEHFKTNEMMTERGFVACLYRHAEAGLGVASSRSTA